MSASKKTKSLSNLDHRFSQVNAELKKINAEIAQLEKSSNISPEGAWIVRYRAKGKGGAYWYYKWQAKDPIFETQDGRKTRNKYIGKAGLFHSNKTQSLDHLLQSHLCPSVIDRKPKIRKRFKAIELRIEKLIVA